MYKEGEWRWLLTAVFTILWLFFLIAAYFWAHKPFDLLLLAGLGRTVGSVAVWLGLLWLATALGKRSIDYWKLELGSQETSEGWVALVLCCGLGLGVLSLLMLGLGLAGLLRPLMAWGLMLLLAVGVRRELTAVGYTLRHLSLPKPTTRFERWLAIYTIATLSLTFLLALPPETAWDALVYHLTGPQLFIEAGRIAHLRDIAYLGFPQLGEMQFMLGMLLFGDGVAPLLHFSYGLFGLIVAAGLAHKLFGREAAWLTAVILLTVPLLADEMGDAYVDLTLLFYTTAVFYLFHLWQTSATWPNHRGLLLVGLFCGFAAGTKYTAVAVPMAIGLNLFWLLRREPLTQIGRQVGWLTAVTTLTTLPWLLKNWLTTGNPVYPFLLDTGVYWDHWRANWYNRAGTGLLATNPWRLLTAPIEASVLGTTGSAAFDATIGPFILGLLFLLPAIWATAANNEKRWVKQLLFFFGVNYLLWLWGLAHSALLLQTRLLLPSFGITAVLAGFVLSRLSHLSRPTLDVGWLSRVVVALTLGLLLLAKVAQTAQTRPLAYLMGQESAEMFQQRQLGFYVPMMKEVNELPAEAQVLFLWEPRSYQCRVTCYPDVLLDRFLHETQGNGLAAREITAVWRQQGITHVLMHNAGLRYVYTDGYDGMTDKEMAIWQEIVQTQLEVTKRWADAYTLYRLLPTSETP